jgi:glutaredoxin 3
MITIYGRDNCYWCQEAKSLAKRYGLEFEYKNTGYEKFRTEMFEKYPDAKTVPQIWWDDRHIGGYDQFVSEIENTLGSHYGQDAF